MLAAYVLNSVLVRPRTISVAKLSRRQPEPGPLRRQANVFSVLSDLRDANPENCADALARAVMKLRPCGAPFSDLSNTGGIASKVGHRPENGARGHMHACLASR